MQRVICSWCDRELQAGDEPSSHGMCPECAVTFMQESSHGRQKNLPFCAEMSVTDGEGPESEEEMAQAETEEGTLRSAQGSLPLDFGR